MVPKISMIWIYVRAFYPTLIVLFQKVWQSFQNQKFYFSPCAFPPRRVLITDIFCRMRISWNIFTPQDEWNTLYTVRKRHFDCSQLNVLTSTLTAPFFAWPELNFFSWTSTCIEVSNILSFSWNILHGEK